MSIYGVGSSITVLLEMKQTIDQLLICCLTYNSKNIFTSSGQKPNSTHYGEDSWIFIQFLDTNQFTDLEFLGLGEAGSF